MVNFENWAISSGINVFCAKAVLSLLFAFGITFFTVPTIIKISRRKNLMDEPGVRSSHVRKIPNLGGIAIFYSIAICASIFAHELFDYYKFLFASLVILLFIGVMDDIVVMRAYKKLLAQVLVSVMIVIFSDVRIRSFFGLFGIYELPYIVSILFSIITFIILINAFNLIDGIDGLAGSYSVLCSLFFGISYYRLGSYNYPLVLLCIVIIGSVSGFLYYNLSNFRTKKIFMGDTGSMVLGFLLAFTAVSFIDVFFNQAYPGKPRYLLPTAPVIAVSILILPIVDTMNVIMVRLKNKKSPLDPDKNHIHHKLLALGLSHRRSTAYIISYYIILVGIAYLLRHLDSTVLLGIMLVLGFFGAYLPDFVMRYRKVAAK